MPREPISEVLWPAPRDPGQKYWDPERQTLDRERLRALQDEGLQELVRRIFERPVPFFQRKLAAAGITSADDIKSVDDLAQVPLTRKYELRESEAEHGPVGDYRFTDLRECVRIGQSSGTTGTPTVMLWTRRDLQVEYESAARMFWRSGGRPGEIATHAHPGYLYAGGLLLSGAYEYFGYVNLWVPPPDTDELAEEGIRAWRRFRPDHPFVGFSLGRYFEVCAKLGLDPRQDVGLGVPSMFAVAGQSKGMPLMTAGAECYAYLGGAYPGVPGGHLNEDWAIVQAVDPETGREVPEGEWGNLVVTTIGRDNCMLRYDLEEACALTREPSPAGETSARGYWGGRAKDLLAAQGRRFQVAELERALRRVAAVTSPSLEFVVVRPSGDDAPVALRVELADGHAADVARTCREAVAEALGIEARVEIVARDSLPRSGYKQNRVVEA